MIIDHANPLFFIGIVRYTDEMPTDVVAGDAPKIRT